MRVRPIGLFCVAAAMACLPIVAATAQKPAAAPKKPAAKQATPRQKPKAIVGPKRPAGARRIFSGPVLRVADADGWFEMKAGASRKLPSVKVKTDRFTSWKGAPGRTGLPKQGEHVVVVAFWTGSDAAHAVSIRLQDPAEEPKVAPKGILQKG